MAAMQCFRAYIAGIDRTNELGATKDWMEPVTVRADLQVQPTPCEELNFTSAKLRCCQCQRSSGVSYDRQL